MNLAECILPQLESESYPELPVNLITDRVVY